MVTRKLLRLRGKRSVRTLLVIGLLGAGLAGAFVVIRLARQTAYLGFESGRFSGWREKLAAPHSARVVRYPVRGGKYAVRFELRTGDDTGDGVRAELKEDFNVPLGKEIWYSFSTFVPADFPILRHPSVISQWHAEEDPGEESASRSPVLAHRYDGRSFVVDIRFSSTKIQHANDGIRQVLYEEKDFPRGVWHDFVYRVRWSYASNGLVEGWLDGKGIISYSGPVGYNDLDGPYFKFGLYHYSGDKPLVIFHDEYRRGFSREAVTRK